jgi:hypothetical protein
MLLQWLHRMAALPCDFLSCHNLYKGMTHVTMGNLSQGTLQIKNITQIISIQRTLSDEPKVNFTIVMKRTLYKGQNGLFQRFHYSQVPL